MRRVMSTRLFGAALIIGCIFVAAAFAQTRGRLWAEYESEMQDPVDDPPDVGRKGEFALGRLRYRSPRDGWGPYARWGIDANKGDRTFIGILRRLTRIDAEPVETIVDIDSDEIFDHPFLLAISAGDWRLTPSQAERLRKYFDRGGFLMVDDFHNEYEWAQFMAGIHQIFADAHIEELAPDNPAFHVIYDLQERVRVVGANVVNSGGIERGGTFPHWRGLMDSRSRMIVAICFNMDVGDGWEWADAPFYPERLATAAIQLGVNYVGYSMTH
jgi:hypothetical protein